MIREVFMTNYKLSREIQSLNKLNSQADDCHPRYKVGRYSSKMTKPFREKPYHNKNNYVNYTRNACDSKSINYKNCEKSENSWALSTSGRKKQEYKTKDFQYSNQNEITLNTSENVVLKVYNLDFAISSEEWEQILHKHFSAFTKVIKIRFLRTSLENSTLSNISNTKNRMTKQSQKIDDFCRDNNKRSNGIAFVTVRNADEASRIIAMFHHKKIGYKKIKVQFVDERCKAKVVSTGRKIRRTFDAIVEDFASLDDQDISNNNDLLIKQSDLSKSGFIKFVPLSIFRSKFVSLNHHRIHLNELNDFPNVKIERFRCDDKDATIGNNFNQLFIGLIENDTLDSEEIKSDAPHSIGTNLDQISSSQDSIPPHVHQSNKYISRDCCNVCNSSFIDEWNIKASWTQSLLCISAPSLRVLTVHVHELLNRHNGTMNICWFVGCHQKRFGIGLLELSLSNNRKNKELSIGIPIEHLLSCVPNVVLDWNEQIALRQIKWARLAQTLTSFYDFVIVKSPKNEHNLLSDDEKLTNQSSSSNTSTSYINYHKTIFSRQSRKLLECKSFLPINSFLGSYHQMFRQQLRVADYGFSKLAQLLHSFPDIFHVLTVDTMICNNNYTFTEDTLTLQHNIQVNRFVGLLYLALNSLNEMNDVFNLDLSYDNMIPLNQLLNVIEFVLKETVYRLINESDNDLSDKIHYKQFNDDNYSNIVKQFTIENFGMSCMDDLIFSIKHFREFIIESDKIGFRKSFRIFDNVQKDIDDFKEICDHDNISNIDNRLFSLDYEIIEILRNKQEMSIPIKNLDNVLRPLIRKNDNCDDMKREKINHKSSNLEYFYLSFDKLAKLTDDLGAGWAYATAITKQLWSLETATVTENDFDLDSTITITNQLNRIRATALNIIELIQFRERNFYKSQISLAELPLLYESFFKFSLDPYLLGFESITDMVLYMCPLWLELSIENPMVVYIKPNKTMQIIRKIIVINLINSLNNGAAQHNEIITITQLQSLIYQKINFVIPTNILVSQIEYLDLVSFVKFNKTKLSIQVGLMTILSKRFIEIVEYDSYFDHNELSSFSIEKILEKYRNLYNELDGLRLNKTNIMQVLNRLEEFDLIQINNCSKENKYETNESITIDFKIRSRNFKRQRVLEGQTSSGKENEYPIMNNSTIDTSLRNHLSDLTNFERYKCDRNLPFFSSNQLDYHKHESNKELVQNELLKKYLNALEMHKLNKSMINFENDQNISDGNANVFQDDNVLSAFDNYIPNKVFQQQQQLLRNDILINPSNDFTLAEELSNYPYYSSSTEFSFESCLISSGYNNLQPYVLRNSHELTDDRCNIYGNQSCNDKRFDNFDSNLVQEHNQQTINRYDMTCDNILNNLKFNDESTTFSPTDFERPTTDSIETCFLKLAVWATNTKSKYVDF